MKTQRTGRIVAFMRFVPWLIALLISSAHVIADDRPNIVVILADDMGSGDARCFNPDSKIPTPNLDKLAASGMKFTNAYCPVSVCSPTRYALMTGSHPARSWKKRGVLGNWDRPMISAGTTTLPGFLKENGYVTAGFGKWHLGADYPTNDGKRPAGEGKFKSPNSGANIDITKPVTGGPVDRGFDVWKGMICSSEMLIIEDRKVAATVGHELYEPLPISGAKDLPVVNTEGLLPRATNDSIQFIRALPGDEVKPFFLYFAPYVPHIPLSVAPEFRGKTKAGDYGDYVHQLDHAIGQLVSSLEERKLLQDTLILFASDNGSQFDKTGEDHQPNGSLRGGKWSIYEGGVRTSLIVSWPGQIPAGSTSESIIALNDVLPTLAGLLGKELPAGAAKDGIDQLTVWKGDLKATPRTEVVTQPSGRGFALRQGEWKFIWNGKPKDSELYHLKDDPAESKNLIEVEKDRGKAMEARLKEIMAGYGREK